MRRLSFKYFGIALLICCAIDFPIFDTFQEDNSVQYAGINNGKYLKEGAKVAKKGWTWLKSCSGKRTPISPNSRRIYGVLPNTNQSHMAEALVKGINDVRSQEEVLPKIGEYLSQTKPNENGKKVINCVKTEANEVRMYLYEQGKYAPTEKTIRIATEAINLAEYDIRALQENYYKGNDGTEYVEFIIPKRAQYILNGQYSNRLYECMVFNIPKDINGNWERFKEYLIAFIDDLMNRPFQLWDEYMFRRGLAELKIDERDITEIERYIFANINKSDYVSTKDLQSQTA